MRMATRQQPQPQQQHQQPHHQHQQQHPGDDDDVLNVVCAEPKIFVGGLRYDVTQEDVGAHYLQYGPLRSAALLVHHDTGKSKGCAMVLFERWTAAEAAVAAEHGVVTRLSAPRQAVVKLADPQRNEHGVLCGVTPRKLFIGQVPASVTPDQVRSIFQPYGNIIDLNIMAPRKAGSMGCAFVTYNTWAEAEAALYAVDGHCTLPGSNHPCAVKFADAKPAELAKFEARGTKRNAWEMGGALGAGVVGGGPSGTGGGGGESSGGSGMMVSVGGGSGSKRQLMRETGRGAMPPMMVGPMMNPMMMGVMGMGPMVMNPMMMPGMQGMMVGMGGPMGVPMMGPKQPGGPGSSGATGSGGGYDPSRGMMAGMPLPMPSMAMGMAPGFMGMPMPMPGASIAMGGGGMMMMPGMGGPMAMAGGPAAAGHGGALAAAKQWKLFVGQISFDLTEDQLHPFFAQFGTILELALPRTDGRSRGYAFLTYSSRAEAQAAIEGANGAVVPSDPRARALTVRWADNKGR